MQFQLLHQEALRSMKDCYVEGQATIGAYGKLGYLLPDGCKKKESPLLGISGFLGRLERPGNDYTIESVSSNYARIPKQYDEIRKILKASYATHKVEVKALLAWSGHLQPTIVSYLCFRKHVLTTYGNSEILNECTTSGWAQHLTINGSIRSQTSR